MDGVVAAVSAAGGGVVVAGGTVEGGGIAAVDGHAAGTAAGGVAAAYGCARSARSAARLAFLRSLAGLPPPPTWLMRSSDANAAFGHDGGGRMVATARWRAGRTDLSSARFSSCIMSISQSMSSYISSDGDEGHDGEGGGEQH